MEARQIHFDGRTKNKEVTKSRVLLNDQGAQVCSLPSLNLFQCLIGTENSAYLAAMKIIVSLAASCFYEGIVVTFLLVSIAMIFKAVRA